MSRFRLDTTKSPPVVIDTTTGSTLTIDEAYKRRWETTSLTEETELTYVLCEVEQHAWGKVHADKSKGKPMTNESCTQYRIIHEHPQVMAPLVVADVETAHRTIEMARKHLGAEVANGLKIQHRTLSPWKDMQK